MRRVLGFLLLAVVLLLLSGPYVLAALGGFLVRADAPAKADAIVVLGGDYTGRRILKACELIRSGYAPVAIVSGPPGFYDRHEDEFAIDWVVKKGCPVEWFSGFRHQATSTRREAHVFREELARRGIRSYLLVTSDYHTRRAGGMFREIVPLPITVIAAPSDHFTPDGWWRDRDGRKIWLMELTKVITDPLGI